MFERSLDEAERILAADKDIIVSVRKIWLQVCEFGKRDTFEVAALSDFTAMLEADKRFEFFSTHRSVIDDLEKEHILPDGEEQSEMENLGFYADDRVKLRRIELTPEMIGELLESKIDHTIKALGQMWELRPEGDVQAEETLKKMIGKTKVLQKKIKTAFSKERMEALSPHTGKDKDSFDKPARKSKPKKKTKNSKKKITKRTAKKKKPSKQKPRRSRK